MKVSIVTVVLNGEKTIESAIQSVLNQTYSDIEYIVIDGRSKDKTVSLINKYLPQISRFVSEADSGIYDGMNKGLQMATGDILGILNADDFLNDPFVIANIVEAFKLDNELSATIADIVFVKDVKLDKIARYYSSKNWQPNKLVWGKMPPHPSFFCKRDVFERLGYYKTDYKIAADYELIIRFFLVNSIKFTYLPMVTTKMRFGGVSTKNLKSIIILNKEISRACKENRVYTNYAMIYSKYFAKITELLNKRNG